MDNSSIIAAIIPATLFIILILYYTVWKGRGYTVKIVKTDHTAKIVALSTKTTDESFIEDDLMLWNDFKKIKDKNVIPDKKEVHSFVSIRMMPANGEKIWEYLIGRIVHDFANVPLGFKTLEIPHQTYAAVHLNVKNEESWGPTIQKLEKYMYEIWLPESNYQINTESKVKSIVYHDKRAKDTTRTIIYYLAIKEIHKPSMNT